MNRETLATAGTVVGVAATITVLTIGVNTTDPAPDEANPGTPPATTTPAPTNTSAPAADTDHGLTVAADMPMQGYNRDAFYHWVSRDYCNTRERVLQRAAVPGTWQRDTQCRPNSGQWLSPYTGATITDDADIDIDHVVPLAEAWRSGAAAWTDEKREQFANDMDRPQLVAVEASVNRAKGDQDPATWLPPRDVCGYTARWIAVKTHYNLTVDPTEARALSETLTRCTPEDTP